MYHHERICEWQRHHPVGGIWRSHTLHTQESQAVGWTRVPTRASGVTNNACQFPMADGDDSAALWKVNRTIHELVKDRVQQTIL